jgi:hypothetical protein
VSNTVMHQIACLLKSFQRGILQALRRKRNLVESSTASPSLTRIRNSVSHSHTQFPVSASQDSSNIHIHNSSKNPMVSARDGAAMNSPYFRAEMRQGPHLSTQHLLQPATLPLTYKTPGHSFALKDHGESAGKTQQESLVLLMRISQLVSSECPSKEFLPRNKWLEPLCINTARRIRSCRLTISSNSRLQSSSSSSSRNVRRTSNSHVQLSWLRRTDKGHNGIILVTKDLRGNTHTDRDLQDSKHRMDSNSTTASQALIGNIKDMGDRSSISSRKISWSSQDRRWLLRKLSARPGKVFSGSETEPKKPSARRERPL